MSTAAGEALRSAALNRLAMPPAAPKSAGKNPDTGTPDTHQSAPGEAGKAAGGGGIGGASRRRTISRATLSSSTSISLRHKAFSGGDEAPGKAFLSNRACTRSNTSQPSNSARRSRKCSRAIRRTRLRVTARGAYFLPVTRPRRAALPVGLA